MLTSLLLPVRCPLCGARGAAPCASCAAAFRPAPVIGPVPACTSVAACFRYDDAVRELLLALKYRNRRDAVAFCAAALAALAPGAVDAVTWAPTTPQRARARGFDQAEVLARAVARTGAAPARRLLVRTGGAPQTGAGAAARRSRPAFACRPRVHVPARVLLLDDIGTTGSTLARAAAALRSGGAVEVHARTVAWTPPRARPTR